MSKRASELLQEMQGIFGGSFGYASASSLTESHEMSESPRPMPRNNPSPRGLLSKGKSAPILRHTTKAKAKKVMKAAAAALKSDPSHKAKQAADEKKFQDVMKDVRGEMDKSKKKSDAKKDAGSGSDSSSAKSAASTMAKGRRHYPFKRSANLGAGPRGKHHDETKCWKCKCGNVYSDGCNCVSSGNGENCPDKGTHKKISYTKSYKRAYNNEYHAWRAKKGGSVTRRTGSTR